MVIQMKVALFRSFLTTLLGGLYDGVEKQGLFARDSCLHSRSQSSSLKQEAVSTSLHSNCSRPKDKFLERAVFFLLQSINDGRSKSLLAITEYAHQRLGAEDIRSWPSSTLSAPGWLDVCARPAILSTLANGRCTGRAETTRVEVLSSAPAECRTSPKNITRSVWRVLSM